MTPPMIGTSVCRQRLYSGRRDAVADEWSELAAVADGNGDLQGGHADRDPRLVPGKQWRLFASARRPIFSRGFH